MRRISSPLSMSLGTVVLSTLLLATLSLYAVTGSAGAATTPHAATLPTGTAVGSCVPGEPGLGTATITFAGFPDGPLSVTGTIEFPYSTETEAFTKPFEVSASDPTPTWTLSDLAPGDYGMSYVATYPGSTPPSPESVPTIGFTVPSCLANGTPSQITAPIAGIAPTLDGAG